MKPTAQTKSLQNFNLTHNYFPTALLARRANAPLGDLFFLLLLSIADFMVGEISGPGDIVDAFFRVHGWFGGRLVTHIDMHLSLIENARFQIGQNRDFDLLALRKGLSIKG